jgi:hypothetical protein
MVNLAHDNRCIFKVYTSRVHQLASTGIMNHQLGIMCKVADEVSFNLTCVKRRKFRT